MRALDWDEIAERLAGARRLLAHTTGGDGGPDASPVWSVVHHDAVYVRGRRRTGMAANLVRDPRLLAHHQSATDALMVRGRVVDLGRPGDHVAIAAAFDDTYDPSDERPFRSADDDADGALYRVEPERAVAWSLPDTEGSARRWRRPGRAPVPGAPRGGGIGPVTVRPGEPDDLARLRRLEWAAGERFREVGLDVVADDEPASLDELRGAVEAGRLWVATTPEAVAGYATGDVLDGLAHVEQLTVDPLRQGLGIGRRLVERVVAWAADEGRPAVTLTTFADVPWNRPLYERLGFRVLAADEIGSDLRGRQRVEADGGLDPARRVAMRRAVAG